MKDGGMGNMVNIKKIDREWHPTDERSKKTRSNKR